MYAGRLAQYLLLVCCLGEAATLVVKLHQIVAPNSCIWMHVRTVIEKHSHYPNRLYLLQTSQEWENLCCLACAISSMSNNEISVPAIPFCQGFLNFSKNAASSNYCS